MTARNAAHNQETVSGVTEWRRGWVLVVVGMLGLAVSTSHIYTTGLFIGPLEKTFGWSRGQISSGLLINSTLAVIFAPFVGALIDRYGTRRVGLPGMGLYCVAIALLSTISPALSSWWATWLLIAIGGLFIKPTLWATAISRRFDRQRALALAVMLSGSGLGSAILPSLVNHLIATIGWRGAYLGLGLGAAVVILPVMAFFLRDRDQAKDQAARDADRLALSGLGIREALLSTRFIRLALSALIMTVTMAGYTVHFVPFAMAHGMDRTTAAAAVGVLGITSIIGRLLTGVLLDRLSGPLIGAASFTIPVVAAGLWLNFDGSFLSAAIIAGAVGFSLGAEIDIIAYLTARYFGLRNYGTILGTIVGLTILGTGLGPTVAGFVYDKTHSYSAFAWWTIPALLVSAAMVGTLGKYPALTTIQASDAKAQGQS